MVKCQDQSKSAFCQAIFNRHLNSESVCPANHEVSYSNGWFYFDKNEPFHKPEWTKLAEEMIKNKTHTVLYWPEGNCYVLGENYND